MLTHLRVKNVALIDDAAIDLDEGLNIFTGETGAGKSILLGSVQLALGARVSGEILGDPEQSASVDLLFDLSGTCAMERLIEQGLLSPQSNGELLISRVISPNGRSVNRLNDQIVTSATLRQVAEELIDIHGQHEHQSLMDAKAHIDLLDRFDDETDRLKKHLRDLLRAYKEKEGTLRECSEQLKDKERLLSLMQYEAGEIDAAALHPGEEKELTQRCRFAQNAVRVRESCRRALEALRGERAVSAVDALNEAIAQLQKIEEMDRGKLEPMISSLIDAAAIAETIASDVDAYDQSIDLDEESLSAMQERLDLIRRLEAKYGPKEEDVLEYREKLTRSMEKTEHLDKVMSGLQKELRELYREMEETCRKLTAVRRRIGDSIGEQITNVLKTLQFQDPQFYVDITSKETISAKGRDQVRFMIRTNVGDSLKMLDKVASGGEISRIMLAVKTVLADRDEIPTLIFDEIDTGISGRTAQSVAEKLSQIACYHQVIAITHLPQIASMGDHHLCIEKIVEDGHARTRVRTLNEEGVIRELARMTGGLELTGTTLQNAAEIRTRALAWKQNA